MAPDLLTLVAEPRRRAILRLVWHRERSAGEIARRFDVTFGAVSQHLKLLETAKVVSVRRSGRHRFYRVNRAGLGPLARYLSALWRPPLLRLKQLAEAEEHRDAVRRGR